MVDRVYRSDLPHLRKALLGLRGEFSRVDSPTDWVRLRIDPLLAHAKQLETKSRIWESSPLRGGVPMLHSDLVYLRENVRALERVLASAKKRPKTGRGSR
jgi:hypothetical protein